MGIEPTPSAWKAEVLPLNYTRRFAQRPPRTCELEVQPSRLTGAEGLDPYCRSMSNQHQPDPVALVEGVGFEPTKA